LYRPHDHGDQLRFGFSGRLGTRRRAAHRNRVNDRQCCTLSQGFNESLPRVRRAREIPGAEVPILRRRPGRLDPVFCAPVLRLHHAGLGRRETPHLADRERLSIENDVPNNGWRMRVLADGIHPEFRSSRCR